MSPNHTNSHTSDEVPSTPPNIAEISPEVSQSARRESTRLRTPVVKPGFVRTEVPKSHQGAPKIRLSPTAFTQVTQVSTRTGKKITVDTVQDSDEENAKVQDKSKKSPESTGYACWWCPSEYRAQNRSNYNLKAHRDGSHYKGSVRSACPGRAKAIAAGAKLPPTATELFKAAAQANPDTAGTLTAFVSKGNFNNETLNKLIVIWIVRHCLPWLRIKDHLIRVAFDYAVHNSHIRSRIWAALQAHKLYVKKRLRVVQAVKDSDLKISMVSNVWTTKGSHKAFLGISCCYINKDWTYVSQHLAIKLLTLAATTSQWPEKLPQSSWLLISPNGKLKRCICHVIALILGAGLKALRISKLMLRSEKADQSFPALATVVEVDEPTEEITKVIKDSDEEDIDPDNAAAGSPEADDNENNDDNSSRGIGLTLKKKQAEWRLWAAKLSYKGRGVIGGYGIQWNIAYKSRSRAYEGRRVIKQLLENESDKCSGKSTAKHFFKKYELSSEEWSDVNSLNISLKDFLEMTKRMEGDKPLLPMVIYEYVRLLNTLEKRKAAAYLSPLAPMFDPMMRTTQKYLNLALECDTVVLATFLHPAWRMMLFHKQFETHVDQIVDLVQKAFDTRRKEIQAGLPPSPLEESSEPNDIGNHSSLDSNGKAFYFTKRCQDGRRL
ncbi:hypothetical protein PTTG_29864 [Puccinia triticina 1-1 BBBD Race 1]|uniref:Uncharacterized protein n=1 Tax=Puccinia triticina (isolate 1-1 / race 1 (BBBD)) TaxID=630390 RepID=A0A180G3W1_PUCT1|nr:hypothetical protein PTTG_29864 [Puccinia triticina 1-1 BBBD Race 1]